MVESELYYKVVVDKAVSKVEELHDPFSQTLRLVPVVAGAKNG
jgi:hypothetical protein